MPRRIRNDNKISSMWTVTPKHNSKKSYQYSPVIIKLQHIPPLRTIFLFSLFLICIQGLGQTQLAEINDPDGYTNFRIDKGSNYDVKGKFQKGDLFITVPSSDDWWLVISYDNKQGYMNKSRISLIKNLNYKEIKRVIFMSLDTLESKRQKFESTNWDSSKILFMDRRESLENFELNIISQRILKLISQQFCKYSDKELLNRFLEAIIKNSNSADEGPAWTLAECYVCNPDIVIQQILRFPKGLIEQLIGELTFGFDNLTYQEESKFKNFKILKDKLETLKKNVNP